MEKRVETSDGRVLHVHVNDETVDANDGSPPIASDDLNEGATQAVVLVDSRPNTMTVEGAIAGIGMMARGMAKNRRPLVEIVPESEPAHRQRQRVRARAWRWVSFAIAILGMVMMVLTRI